MSKNKGRPGKIEQMKIQERLWSYFERGVTASYASGRTGLNIKTVCKYFDKWMGEIRETEQKEFASRQREQRERIILNYDDLIFQEYEFLGDIKYEIKRCKDKKLQIPKHFMNLHQDIIKTLASLMEKKGYFSMQMPIDESVQKMIEEKIKHAYPKSSR